MQLSRRLTSPRRAQKPFASAPTLLPAVDFAFAPFPLSTFLSPGTVERTFGIAQTTCGTTTSTTLPVCELSLQLLHKPGDNHAAALALPATIVASPTHTLLGHHGESRGLPRVSNRGRGRISVQGMRRGMTSRPASLSSSTHSSLDPRGRQGL